MFRVPTEARLLSIAFHPGRLALEDRNPMSAIEELSLRYSQAWAEHDLDAIMALHSADTVLHIHGGGLPATGQAETRETVAAIFAQWPDLRFDPRRVHFSDTHFVSEYEMSGTADGERVACDGADVICVTDGLVTRKDTYLDWPQLQLQLGGTPALSGSVTVARS
jgi:ketosteroid isomerase-like protein